MSRTRAHVMVEGRVQGVFFRGFARERAEAGEVEGWVRNAPDGGVEAVFEGEERAVRALVEDLRRGPPGARVIRLHVSYEVPTGEFKGFSIRY